MALDIKADEILWVQKYRPQKVADTILPEKTKKIFQKFVDEQNIPIFCFPVLQGLVKLLLQKQCLKKLVLTTS